MVPMPNAAAPAATGTATPSAGAAKPANKAAAATGITVPTALAIKSIGAVAMPCKAATTWAPAPLSSASCCSLATSALSPLDCADNKLSNKSSMPRKFSDTTLSAPKASVIARTP